MHRVQERQRNHRGERRDHQPQGVCYHALSIPLPAVFSTHPAMNFCSHCGAKVAFRVPPGDTLPRHLCDACGTIHYKNPLVVVGSIPESDGRILLCKRAIEPRAGFWTLPAGFMELGETIAEGAMRETL